MNADIVIIGSGVAGLICALTLDPSKKIIILSKKKLEDSNSYLAQGGICIRRGKEDEASFIEDTLKAGHYKNNPEAVSILVNESEAAIKTLLEYHVPFEHDRDGMKYTREGGHSKSRILYCGDHTGASIMDALIQELKERKNITIMEDTTMVDLLVHNNTCYGIYASKNNQLFKIESSYTVLATGGIGGLFTNSTNYRHIQGDGLLLALAYNIKTKDMDYVQFHPTAFYEETNGRRFLISESVRGEGGILLNKEKKRFVNELLTRDIVSAAILKEMEKDNRPFEWLSMKEIPLDIDQRFPKICNYLRDKGIEPKVDLLPIVPAQHYMMGGIKVNPVGKTSMNHLFAIGEVACTGVHGANRLASNSLLESVVFAKRTANNIDKNFQAISQVTPDHTKTNINKYRQKLQELIHVV